MSNLKIDTTVRNNMLDEIATGAGSGALIKIYAGAQPGGGGTPTGTLLATLSISGVFAAAASAGVLTLSSVTSDTNAAATGTATWFRVTTSASGWILDGDVSITGGGGDLELDSISIALNGTVAITGVNTLTAPNAA